MADTNGTVVVNGKPYYGPVGETSAQILLEKTFMASGYLTGVGFGTLICLCKFGSTDLAFPMFRYSAGDLRCLYYELGAKKRQESVHILPHGIHDDFMSHERIVDVNICVRSSTYLH